MPGLFSTPPTSQDRLFCVALAIFELRDLPVCLHSVGIKGMCHHTQFSFVLLKAITKFKNQKCSHPEEVRSRDSSLLQGLSLLFPEPRQAWDYTWLGQAKVFPAQGPDFTGNLSLSPQTITPCSRVRPLDGRPCYCLATHLLSKAFSKCQGLLSELPTP